MLIDEIERLHVDLWNAKGVSADAAADLESKPDLERSLEMNERNGLSETLRNKLSRRRRQA